MLKDGECLYHDIAPNIMQCTSGVILLVSTIYNDLNDSITYI
jgi:hypothetical protein